MRNFILNLPMLFLLLSCSHKEEGEPVSMHQHITATIYENTSTKTVLSPDDEGSIRKVLWSNGDRIVLSGSSDKVYITNNDGTASATFFPEDGIMPLDLSRGIIAAYPAEGTYMSGPDAEKEIYLTIPATQYYKKGTFADGTMPMVSDVSFNDELSFRNAAGVLRLLISTNFMDVNVSSILIQANEVIASDTGGDMCYIPATRQYNLDPEFTYGGNTVRLECGDGVHIDSAGTPFHVVVPHQTYTGMTITVNTTDGEKQMFTLKEGKEITVKRSGISTIPLSIDGLARPAVSIEQTYSTFKSIMVRIEMENVSSFYCGIAPKETFEKALDSGNLAEEAKYSTLYTNSSDKVVYEGSALRFQKELADMILLEPGQSYMMWILPYKDSGTYTSADFSYSEIFTQELRPGGNIEVSYSDLVIDQTSISMTLTAKDASLMYAAMFDEKTMSRFSTDEELIEYLISPEGPAVILENSTEILVRKQLDPDTDMTVVVLPVDITGVYGRLFTHRFRTLAIPYNDLSVVIEEAVVKENGTDLIRWHVNDEDAVSYRYILKETDSYMWTNTLKSSVLKAQEIMYLSPGMYYINKTRDNYVPLENLAKGVEYILIVAAVDENDASSIADSWTFTY